MPIGRKLESDERKSEHDECGEHKLNRATRLDNRQRTCHQHFRNDNDQFCWLETVEHISETVRNVRI